MGKEKVYTYNNAGSYKKGSVIHKTYSLKIGVNLQKLGVKSELREDVYRSKHFWRGLLDGDGSIIMSKNQGKIYPYLAWSGNERDMLECSNYLGQILKEPKPKLSQVKSIFTVRLVGTKAY